MDERSLANDRRCSSWTCVRQEIKDQTHHACSDARTAERPTMWLGGGRMRQRLSQTNATESENKDPCGIKEMTVHIDQEIHAQADVGPRSRITIIPNPATIKRAFPAERDNPWAMSRKKWMSSSKSAHGSTVRVRVHQTRTS